MSAAEAQAEAAVPPPPPDMRRVVTTHEGAKAVVWHDTTVAPQLVPGSTTSRFGNIWHFDSVPAEDNNLPIDGAERAVTGPGLGVVHARGVAVRHYDLAPGASVPMHRTTSTDVDILVSGELLLVLDDGSETRLTRAGDVVVQRGTMHAWRNPSATEWTRIITVIVDAAPVVVEGTELENEMRSE